MDGLSHGVIPTFGLPHGWTMKAQNHRSNNVALMSPNGFVDILRVSHTNSFPQHLAEVVHPIRRSALCPARSLRSTFSLRRSTRKSARLWGNKQKIIGFQKLGYAKIDGFWWKIILKWMIWRYPHFRNPPILVNVIQQFWGTSGWMTDLWPAQPWTPNSFSMPNGYRVSKKDEHRPAGCSHFLVS